MDTQEKEQLAQEQMAELCAALKDIDLTPEDPTVTHVGTVSGNYEYESILSTSGADTITLSGLGGYNTMAGLGAYTNTGPYTIRAGTNTITTNPWSPTTAGRMQLDGDQADIVVNGVSLMKVLRDRLNVMIPNPALEKEWAELKELGEQYRALEAKLTEQGNMWAKLKAMPPPDPL